jgi:hypothetical protein
MLLNIILGLHFLYFSWGCFNVASINANFRRPIASLSWGAKTGFISFLILLYRLGL